MKWRQILVGACLCCVGSFSFADSVISGIVDFANDELDVMKKIIQFKSGGYTFDSAIEVTTNSWKLLGAPLNSGTPATALIAANAPGNSFFKFSDGFGGTTFCGIERLSFSNGRNFANSGGAICADNFRGLISDVVFNDNTTSLESDCTYGGALCVQKVFIGDIIRAKFIENTAGDVNGLNGNGGALYAYSISGIITDSLFDSNKVLGNRKSDGGAVASYVSTCDIIRSEFIRNTATGCGGAIFASVFNGNIYDSLFEGNESRTGG
ncbi:MAG: hypothetical protein LBC42_00825, partial [Puniceicoccales bacterium]|nr:hypothetical protein [Puniceicoccales bacterium]